MSLINCPECGKEISDRANSCPNCGYPIKETAKYKIIINKYCDTDVAAIAGLNNTFDLSMDYDEGMDILNNCPFKIAEYDIYEEALINAKKLKSIQWGLVY